MAKYLLLESRDPFEYAEVGNDYELAAGLARAGNEVTLFLVQNGVLPARRGADGGALAAAAAAGVEILGDEFSLRERGIQDADLVPDVKPTTLDVVVDQLADGRKAMWL
jgi:predicted peroxiredoxin